MSGLNYHAIKLLTFSYIFNLGPLLHCKLCHTLNHLVQLTRPHGLPRRTLADFHASTSWVLFHLPPASGKRWANQLGPWGAGGVAVGVKAPIGTGPSQCTDGDSNTNEMKSSEASFPHCIHFRRPSKSKVFWLGSCVVLYLQLASPSPLPRLECVHRLLT